VTCFSFEKETHACDASKSKIKIFDGDIAVILNISKRHESAGAGIERGVYYFELSDYPQIADVELNIIRAFISYEKSYGRETEIICADNNVLSVIKDAVTRLDGTENILPLETDEFVYHGTGPNTARKILSCGKLLSATKVCGKTGEQLAYEKRESPWNDPADYFEYIMFCWGDNPTGDYVVLSENFPSEDDLANGNFNAGVRFYFQYNVLIRHPGHRFDGYHPIKVKEEIVLTDYLHSCIVPEQYKSKIESVVPPELAAKVHYLPQKGLSLDHWNKEVYDFVRKL